MDLITKNSPKKFSACKEFGIKTLDVFGSAVSGKFNDTSDVDFIVVFSDSKRTLPPFHWTQITS
jgi:predicted nucleotidyltransferase